MKVLGLIVEYNPFHNGHLYHLEQSKKECNADFVVCVMSGNFIQRGEPAIVNKWARTKMAILSGVDLVIELPSVYAMSSAEFFAFGAVKILDSIGITDYICFGSESGKIEELDTIAEILNNEPQSFKAYLKENLSSGLSFPASREAALLRYLKVNSDFAGNIESILSSSNNILGIEYLKALKKLKSKIKPLTIKRISNAYNEEDLTGSISSATSIRNHILRNQAASNPHLNKLLFENSITNTLPEVNLSILDEEFLNGRGPLEALNFEDILLALLRKLSRNKLSSYPYVSEGLENRIKDAADISGNLKELIDNISTKRYTTTRIQRILFNILIGITRNEFDTFNKFGGPQYIRVLGFNKKGQKLLSKINKTSILPVIVKTADFKSSCNPLLRRMLEIEDLATNLYVLGYSNSLYKRSGQEFTQNIIISNE